MVTGHDRIGFDFNQPIWIDEARYLHYSIRRPDRPEHFTVNSRDCLPVIDARQKNYEDRPRTAPKVLGR